MTKGLSWSGFRRRSWGRRPGWDRRRKSDVAAGLRTCPDFEEKEEKTRNFIVEFYFLTTGGKGLRQNGHFAAF